MNTTIAQPEELSLSLATSAHAYTSFSPDKRGASEQQGYADDVNGVYTELQDLCTNDAQRDLLGAEILRYKAGYLRMYGKFLSSRSRCASSMITGPSNFPGQQMEKRNDSANRRLVEFVEWQKRARAAIESALLAARTPEEKSESTWERLRRGIDRDLETIEGVDERGDYWTRAAFVNSIVGKTERLAVSGEASVVACAVALVESYNATHKKPAISKASKFWTFLSIALAVNARKSQADGESQTLYDHEGTTVVVNPACDRIQVFFTTIPDESLRSEFRGAGWNWSPSAGAWQRKITDATKLSTERILKYGRFAPKDAAAGGSK